MSRKNLRAGMVLELYRLHPRWWQTFVVAREHVDFYGNNNAEINAAHVIRTAHQILQRKQPKSPPPPADVNGLVGVSLGEGIVSDANRR